MNSGLYKEIYTSPNHFGKKDVLLAKQGLKLHG